MANTESAVPEAEPGRSASWAHRYPPLLSLLVAMALAVWILPSSLNVPQSNPSTTLEFAPVPPNDEDPPPPPGGNLSSLGLAGSGTLEEGGLPGGDEGIGADLPPPPDVIPGGVGKSPRTKRCVGNPPKQTEDPLAPPCVADFSGDNFGSTYLGVTGEEIRILVYFQGGYTYVNTCSDPNQNTPNGRYFDAMKDPEPGEHCLVRYVRTWQKYFNDRFQTYGRFAHFFIYVSGTGSSPEQRKAEAADNFDQIKPFAVFRDDLASENIDSYLEAMARRGVLVFDASFGRKAAFYQKHAPRIWGYFPTQEIVAKIFAGLICKKVVPFDTAVGQYAGQPRKLGLVYTTDPDRPELRTYKDQVLLELEKQCGVKGSDLVQGTYPSAGWAADTRYSTRHVQTQMANFRSQNVTTIIWPGGLDTSMTKAAKALGYFPEWIVSGDRQIETDTSGTFQDQDVWDNAFMMTNLTLVENARTSTCYLAYREADPDSDDIEAQVACELYPYFRQLFTGIQAAGPKLTPQSIDAGFHAIPKIKSTDPSVPACFYETDDYTCVKDATLEKWDRTGNDDGCYRLIEGGARYFAEIWPDGNINAQYNPDTAPCNDYDASFQVNPGTPEPDNL